MLGAGDGRREWVAAAQSAAVAVTSSSVSADLVTTLLATHGIRAWHEDYAAVYPSVAWVQGHRVRVEASDRDRAAELLRALDVEASVVDGDGDPAGPA